VFHEHPAVRDVCVHAVASELSEDDVKVTVVLKDLKEPKEPKEPKGLKDGETLTEEALCRWSIEHLPYYAVPRYFEFRDALPMSETGRSAKHLLRAEGVTASTWDREAAGVTFERR
jgi:crotonobetaine/carnitine-CoA ligase